MKNKETFMESWKIQRQKGKLMYVFTQAGRLAVLGLAGVVLGSVFLYDSPRAYSFVYYFPTYNFVFLGIFLAASLKFKYQWGKNEDKYNHLSNNH